MGRRRKEGRREGGEEGGKNREKKGKKRQYKNLWDVRYEMQQWYQICLYKYVLRTKGKHTLRCKGSYDENVSSNWKHGKKLLKKLKEPNANSGIKNSITKI